MRDLKPTDEQMSDWISSVQGKELINRLKSRLDRYSRSWHTVEQAPTPQEAARLQGAAGELAKLINALEGGDLRKTK